MSTPMTAPTTGADETLRERFAKIIWAKTMFAERVELWNDFKDTMGAWVSFEAADEIIALLPVTAVTDAELRAIADWRSQHNDDMWELFDYIEAGIDEEMDVAQRYVMRERFDELRALLEARHLAAGVAARTEVGG